MGVVPTALVMVFPLSLLPTKTFSSQLFDLKMNAFHLELSADIDDIFSQQAVNPGRAEQSLRDKRAVSRCPFKRQDDSPPLLLVNPPTCNGA